MKNEILEEVWRVKDALGAKYNYDIGAMFRDLRKREKTSAPKLISLVKPKHKLAKA